MIRTLTFAAGLAALLAAGTPASATSFCYVKSTSDGFAALRAAPSTDGRMIARLAAGDEVMLVGAPQGRWQRVRWWRGEERVERSRANPRGEGWLHRGLIDEELCG